MTADSTANPTPDRLMTATLKAALVAATLSLCVHLTTTRTINGVVVEFTDYGAVAGGVAAVLIALFGLKDVLHLHTGLSADHFDKASLPPNDDLPVRVLFDKDSGLYVFFSRTPIFHLLDVDSRHKRQFLSHMTEQFFPDDF